MNIFMLDEDVVKNAQYHCDKHLIKQILEYTQILCTVVNENGFIAPYRSTHKNHPCTKWAEENLSNWLYLQELVRVLNEEFKFRNGHLVDHKSALVARNLPKPNLKLAPMTPFVLCMPDDCKIGNDPVKSYRNYYNTHKRHLFSWKNRDTPNWITKR